GHLRLAHRGVHAELAHHAVDDDLQVQFAHAGDERLPCLLVEADPERRVLFGKLAQGLGHLVLVGLGLGLYGLGDDRFGELDRFEDEGSGRVREGVAGEGVLEAYGGDDVAGGGFAYFFALVGVHTQEASETLLLVARRVEDGAAALDLARVYADVGQAAHVLVLHDLEDEAHHGLVVVGPALLFDAGLGVVPFHRRDVLRRRPLLRRAEPQSTGVIEPARVARRSAFLSSVTVTCRPSTYEIMSCSSSSATFSMRRSRARSNASWKSAGTGRSSGAASRSPEKYQARSSTRSITPWKSASAPQGIWIGIGRASRRSAIMSTVRQKSAPVRSILLTKQIRGTL